MQSSEIATERSLKEEQGHEAVKSSKANESTHSKSSSTGPPWMASIPPASLCLTFTNSSHSLLQTTPRLTLFSRNTEQIRHRDKV